MYVEGRQLFMSPAPVYPLRAFFGPFWSITDIGAFYLGKLCKELGESGEFYAMEGSPRQP